MMYFGGKTKISKELANFINSELKEGQTFIDLFCGSCNIISKIDPNRKRIANDKHKYLISMWNELQKGWYPPINLSKEEYLHIKENKEEYPYLTGFVGFGCSFSGKWFGGYASNSRGDNYCKSAYNSTLKKFNNLKDVLFLNYEYYMVDIPDGSLIYCDIPYKNTTQYCKKEVGEFNHDDFYKWVRENSICNDIYISEYKSNIPKDFEIVLEINSKKEIRNKDNVRENTVEVLIRYKK